MPGHLLRIIKITKKNNHALVKNATVFDIIVVLLNKICKKVFGVWRRQTHKIFGGIRVNK